MFRRLILGVLLLALAAGVASQLPELRRYLRIKRM
jgi:hypothetical protein